MHVITRLGLGGAERIAETIATNMTRSDTTSIIVPIAAYTDAVMATAMRDKLERHDVKVIAGGRATGTRRAAFEAVPRLGRIVDRWHPDIVHLHTEIPEFSWAMATITSRAARRTPVVRTIHNTILWGGWSVAGRFAERRLTNAAVVAVSRAASDAFVAWGVGDGRGVVRPSVIYNGVEAVDVDRPVEVRQIPVLCFAGRFEPQKGIDVMLDALPQIRHPYRLLVFGSGSLESRVAEAARADPKHLDLSAPIPDLRDRFGEYDAILMPSRFEGLSNLAVEALYGGVPLLATDAPGLSEAMPEWYPGRCRAGDPAAFAAMVDEFLSEPATWTDAVARARIWARERFSAATMVEHYRALYDTTIAARTAAADR